MKPSELHNLASAWIALQQSARGSSDHEKHFWAFETFKRLSSQQPETCWDAINAIRAMDGQDKILANLAAGPLEDLLALHGQAFIGRVEELARKDTQFHKMIGAIWQNNIEDAVWQRIRAVACASF